MSSRIFSAALQNRLMTLILVIVFVAIGLRAAMLLPIDASPDVTPVVVQIVTEASGLGAGEVEKLITFPVEISMRGLTGIKEIRSISRFGLSSVSVYFDEHLDIYFARRLVMERLPSAAGMIPKGYGPPEMTPVSTTLGEIYQFQVIDPNRSLMDLRSILDWQIAPRLICLAGGAATSSSACRFGPRRKTCLCASACPSRCRRKLGSWPRSRPLAAWASPAPRQGAAASCGTACACPGGSACSR